MWISSGLSTLLASVHVNQSCLCVLHQAWHLGFLFTSHHLSDLKPHHCHCINFAELGGDLLSDTRLLSHWCSQRCYSSPQSRPQGRGEWSHGSCYDFPWQVCCGPQSSTEFGHTGLLTFIPGHSSQDAQGSHCCSPLGLRPHCWVWLTWIPIYISPFQWIIHQEAKLPS